MAMIDFKGAMKTLIEAVQLTLTFMVLLVIAVIIGGVLIYAVTGGSINVSTGFNAVLNSFDSTTSAWFTTIAVAGTTAVALIIVVFLIKLFKKYLGFGGKGGSKGGSSY